MLQQQPSALEPPVSANPSRPRWLWLYFVLAAFDLLTVSFSLYVTHQLMTLYVETVEDNEAWAQRLGRYADLARLAARVNAPGNDVFDSLDVEAEATRMATALVVFQAAFIAAQQEIARHVPPALARPLLDAFQQIQEAMEAMTAEAEQIFFFFRQQQAVAAGGRMATMDRRYEAVNAALAALGHQVRLVQQAHFVTQQTTAQKLRRAEYLIAIAIAVMVLAVTFYGHKMARTVLNSAREREQAFSAVREARDALEARVEERTAALLRTNRVLTQEIQERQRAEQEIHTLNAALEQRVQERTAELEVSNKELEAFCYSVSHDLRAPLRAIDGFSQALLEDYAPHLDTPAQHYLNRVRSASQRMGVLIDALLNLSRLTRQPMQRTMVDLSALATAIAAEWQATQPERAVVWVIAPDLVAAADVALLRVVLDNLLGNAWKYTSHHPQARIEFSRMDQDGRTVYVVRDDGAGFDSAYVDKLFGAFQRLHRESEFPGTGIGLATVERIVQRHGGRVWAEGAVEQGATFYFTLAPQEPTSGNAREHS